MTDTEPNSYTRATTIQIEITCIVLEFGKPLVLYQHLFNYRLLLKLALVVATEAVGG